MGYWVPVQRVSLCGQWADEAGSERMKQTERVTPDCGGVSRRETQMHEHTTAVGTSTGGRARHEKEHARHDMQRSTFALQQEDVYGLGPPLLGEGCMRSSGEGTQQGFKTRSKAQVRGAGSRLEKASRGKQQGFKAQVNGGQSWAGEGPVHEDSKGARMHAARKGQGLRWYKETQCVGTLAW